MKRVREYTRKSVLVGVLILIALLASGCGGSEPIGKIELGQVIGTRTVISTWSQNAETVVETEKMDVIISGHKSVMKNVNAWIDVYDNGDKFLCIEGNAICWYAW